MPADLYDVLGISDDASAEEIKHAYRGRVREYHPDVNDHPEGDAQFKLVRKANDVLSNPAERKDYDRLGHREYVEKRLDDLPPISVFPEEDLPDGALADTGTAEPSSDRGENSQTATSRASTSSTTSSRSSTSSTTSSRSSTSSTTSSTSTGGESSGRTQRDDSDAASSTHTSTDRDSSAATTDTADASTAAGTEHDSWAGATAARSTETESTTSAGVRRRRGLKRWYGVVALSLVLYLAGLGIYAAPHESTIRSLATEFVNSPVATLTAEYPLASPAAYVVEAATTVSTPGSGLVLVAGTALLPLVVLTTVGRFGRGVAWMYALPSLAPAVSLELWYVMTVPTWLALLGMVILPILSAGGFLVDVGRYLRATR